jgi:hypothetical protein
LNNDDADRKPMHGDKNMFEIGMLKMAVDKIKAQGDTNLGT